MSSYLVPDFLNNPVQYEKAETIWREHWAKLVREVGQEANWRTPWMNTFFNNGTPFRDGNPIFTAVCPSRRLGIRIVQVEPEDDPNELTFWTDTFAEGDPEEIKELVIHCVLSDETLREAERLMRCWITEGAVGLTRQAS